MENEKCKSCLYYCSRTETCDYILIVGHSRGCSVKNCDRYENNKIAEKLSRYYAGTGSLPDTDKALLELYEQGLSDVEIGCITGKGMMLIRHWRMKMGLLSRRDLEVAVYED